MLALFCLRLAFGMLGALLLVLPARVNPRFYRTHFLTALGLGAGALVLVGPAAGWQLRAILGAALVLAFLGSAAWSLEGAPGGRALVVLTAAALGAGLWLAQDAVTPSVAPALGAPWWLLADGLTSSALLGAAL